MQKVCFQSSNKISFKMAKRLHFVHTTVGILIVSFTISRMSSESFFWQLGHTYTGHKLCLSESLGTRRFKNLYGVSPNICSKIWEMLEFSIPEPCQPLHLLWTLNFLKQYNTESTSSVREDVP